MRLSVIAYVVPFLFVLHPELLLKGSWDAIVIAGFGALAGAACLSAAVVGFLIRPMAWTARLAMVVAGAALLSAEPITDLFGIVLALATMLWLKRKGKPAVNDERG